MEESLSSLDKSVSPVVNEVLETGMNVIIKDTTSFSFHYGIQSSPMKLLEISFHCEQYAEDGPFRRRSVKAADLSHCVKRPFQALKRNC